MKILSTKIILFIISVLLSGNFLYAQTAIRLGTGTNISPVANSTTATAYPLSPINISYGNLRCQILYLASEITAEGITGTDKELRKFGFYIESAPDVPLPNFKIRMAHTNLTSLNATDPTPVTQVYSNPSYMPKAGGFDTLTLTTPFLWNGTNNILVDICFDPVSTVSQSGSVRIYGGANYARTSIKGDNTNANQCLVATYGAISKPQCVMVFCCYTRDVELFNIENPAKPFPQGQQDVLVRIRNFSSVKLDSVLISWKINNVPQPAFKWKGSLNSGNISAPIAVGSYNFIQGDKYSVQASVSVPNGGADQNTVNDSKSLSDLYPGLSGIYTIGGINPDFNSVISAVDIIKKTGVIGPVTFNLRDSLSYDEQAIIPEIAGASETNRIVFQSESQNRDSVIILHKSTTGNPYMFLLDGADYITFRHLTFKTYQTGATTSPGTTFILQNGASHNIFEYNRIESHVSNSVGYAQNIILRPSNVQNEYNVFRRNQIVKGTDGIIFDGFPMPNSPVVYGKGTRIEENDFQSQVYSTINMQYQVSPVITGNTLYSVATSTTNYGINLRNCKSNSGEKGLIANNFLLMDISSGGINIDNSEGLDLYHNSINVIGSGTTRSPLNITNANTKNITSKNNIFSTRTGSKAIVFNGDSATFISDNNDYFTSGAVLGSWKGKDKANLAEWKTASSKDAQSLAVDPAFVDVGNLHTFSVDLNGKGIPVAEVQTDIDGQVRDPNTPDIGADEYTIGKDGTVTQISSPLPSDIIVLNDPQVIQIRISNAGNDMLTNFPVNYTVNGGTAVEEIFMDTILPGASKQYIFDSLWTPVTAGTYAICASTNITGEQNPVNDQLCVSVNAQDIVIDAGVIEILSPPANAMVSVSYPVTVKVQNFGDIALTNFIIKVEMNELPFIEYLYSGTLMPDSIAEVTFTKNFEPIVEDVYIFKAFTVVDNDAALMNDTVKRTVTVGPVGLFSESATQLKVYPNPSTGQVTLRFTLLHSTPVKVNCINFLGQTVLAEEIGVMPSGQNNYILNTTHLPAGAYMVLLDTGKRIEKALLIRQD